MKKFLIKFYDMIDKIGKRNFMLLTFVLFFLVISGLYATFSLYTSSEGLSIVDGVKTFKFVLNSDNTENSVTIAAGTSKNIAITVSNTDEIDLKYGIYYSSSADLTNVFLGYKYNTDYLPNGIIDSGEDYIVTIQVVNDSTSNVTLNFGILYGVENGGDLILETGQYWLDLFVKSDYYYSDSTNTYIAMKDELEDFSVSPTTYAYTGGSQSFVASRTGMYKLEAWGAQGGSYSSSVVGGKGAYTMGLLELTENETLYVYVGGQGGSTNAITNTGGYNGGGASGNNAGGYSMGGGGATDFRLVNGTWNDVTSLRSRIMIAAGGGGNVSAGGYTSTPGYGGALVGGTGGGTYTNSPDVTGATQTSGGTGYIADKNGFYGYAQQTIISGWGGGGGGGHYGGAMGNGKGGAGGSSYISGYTGSVAVTSASDSTPKSGCTDGTTDVSCSYHYSGKIFKDTRMIAGNASMSSKDATGTMIGNSGNGYAKVTPVVPTIYAPNLVVIQGNELDIDAIQCVDNGSGCEIISMPHKDTTSLLPGEHTLSIVVEDDLGVTYQYFRTLTVIDNTELTALAEVHPGSYVKYVGNNGCSGNACSGQNANYVSVSNMGYCYSANYPFNVNGWRVAYINDSSAYLISAGSPECIATSSSGGISSGNLSSGMELTNQLPLHTANVNNQSLNYCNRAFVQGNVCSSSTVWAMNLTDFQKITGNPLSDTSCFELDKNIECGYGNNLIDNGGDYWFAHYSLSSPERMYNWYPAPDGGRRVSQAYVNAAVGIRPVSKISSSVIVVGGTGTYEDPYLIDNPNTIKDLSGNMNNGVLIGSQNWNKENGTVSMSGNSNWISGGLINYDFDSTASIVMRVKFNALTDGTTIQEFFGNWESGGMGIGLKANNTLYYNAYINSAYPEAVNTATVTTNTWYTVVGTYDGSQMLLYVNGTQVAATSVTGTIGLSAAPFAIGGNPSSIYDVVTTSANAVYSDALIFDRALSSEEISTYYSGEIHVANTQDLVLHYDFKR